MVGCQHPAHHPCVRPAYLARAASSTHPPPRLGNLPSPPHGGLRPSHQKPTCLTGLTPGAYVVQVWSRNARNFEPMKPSKATVWFLGWRRSHGEAVRNFMWTREGEADASRKQRRCIWQLQKWGHLNQWVWQLKKWGQKIFRFRARRTWTRR